MFGGKVRKINDSLYQLMRGEVYTIEGKKIFTFGGASSIEKYYINLEEGIDWFKDEECTKDEAIYALNNLRNVNNNIDIVLTHTCSLSSLKKICTEFNMVLEKEDNQNIFFDYLKNKIDYSIWLFGHMHLDFDINNKEKAIFNKVIDLNELFVEKKSYSIYDIEKISRLGVSEFYIEKFK